MDPQIFWNSTRLWPLTPEKDGVVFLAVAMNAIGRARYPDWHGHEPWMPVSDIALPEEQSSAPLAARRAALVTLNRHREGVLVRPPGPWEEAGGFSESEATGDLPMISAADWELARRRVAEVSEFAASAHRRWHDIVEATFAFLKSGTLETVLRSDVGGSYQQAPADLWNIELRHVMVRFGLCQVNLASPFAQRSYERMPGMDDVVGQQDYHSIFVSAGPLKKLLRNINALPDGGSAGVGAASSSGKRGPKPKYPWAAFRAEMERLWEHYGGLSLDDPEFRQQSDFERKMIGWCDHSWAETPGESTIREKVSSFIADKATEASNSGQ